MQTSTTEHRNFSVSLVVLASAGVVAALALTVLQSAPTTWTILAIISVLLLLSQCVMVNTPRRNGQIEPVPTSAMWLTMLLLLGPLSYALLMAVAAQVVFDLRRRHSLATFLASVPRVMIVVSIAGSVHAVSSAYFPEQMHDPAMSGLKLASFLLVSFVYLATTVILSVLDTSLRDGIPPLEVLREDVDLRMRIYLVYTITSPLVTAGLTAYGWWVIFVGVLSSSNVKYATDLICSSERRATFDQLTGIGNRALFWTLSINALRRARSTGRQVAIFMLDVDHFKQINDKLGHEAGDLVIREVATRLSTQLPPEVKAFRLGGDEFVLLIENAQSLEQLANIGQQVLSVVSAPMEDPQMGASRIVVSTSVGIALFPEHAEDAHTLLKNADTAMYRAKEERNTVCLYEPTETDSAGVGDLELLADLHQAVHGGELDVYYQPKISVRSGAVVGVEALVRWEHPTRGVISPEIFVPIAEHAGLITAMTEFTLHRAAADVTTLHEDGRMLDLSVNLSAHLLGSPAMDQWLEEAKGASLALDYLTLEVTETTLGKNVARSTRMLQELRTQGVQISIDDYGTGFISLARIAELRPDELKIDRSFVANLDDPTAAAIVASTITLCQTLNIRVVAEGVETSNQADRLEAMGAHVFQGYFFAKPMSLQELVQWLRTSEKSPVGRTR